MFIQKLRLQNYRCFSDQTFSFDKKFVLIEGANGSGKTTILEALHYGCFLKSFRTNRVRDLFSFDQKNFFLQVDFEEKAGDFNHVQVGISLDEKAPKRLVKFNKKVIKSYRDLISHYRIVSLTENDLMLVQGAPEVRRYFLNQLCVLFKPDLIGHLRKYKQILEHRNSILSTINESMLTKNTELKIWSKQLWEESRLLQQERIAHLKELEKDINELLAEHFSSLDLKIGFSYQVKNKISDYETFEDFWKGYSSKLETEWRWRRSLFGAHLDDFSVIFQEKKAKQFASRGQQKLVLFLLKIALAEKLEKKNMQVTLLLDDFLTDFDHQRLTDCLSLLSKLSCQVFITCPLKSLITKHYTESPDLMQVISL